MSSDSEQELTIGALAVWLRSMSRSFERLRDEVFPEGTVVNSAEYGYAIVPARQPAEQKPWMFMLTVELGVRWVMVSDVKASPDSESHHWPWWIKRKKGLMNSE